MELINYINILKKHLAFILTLSILGAMVAYTSTSFIKSGVVFERTLFLKIIENDSNSNTQLDVSALTDTSVAYVGSADFLNSANTHQAAVSVRKLAPQIIRLTVTSPSPETSREVSQNVVGIFNNRAKDLTTTAQVELLQTGEPNEPAKQVLNRQILAIFGAFIGATLSLVILMLSQYFRL